MRQIETMAAALALALAAGAAQAQGCGAAMPAFRAALEANTAEAVAGFLAEHPGCFTAPAEAKLAALGGAPAETGPARYEGAPIRLSVLAVRNFLGQRVIAADDAFWTEAVPEAGDFRVDLRPGYGGLSIYDIGPAIAEGDVDAALVYADTMFSVDGRMSDVFAGLDVPFSASSAAEARALLEAARPIADETFAEAGLVLLAAAPLLPRVLVCDGETNLDGARIRAVGARARGYEGLGARTERIGFGEVAAALQRDVIDCVDTVPGIAMLVGLHRTGGTVAPAPVSGFGTMALAMNAQAWGRMPEEARGALAAAAAAFEASAWEEAERALQADLDCMTGRGSCPEGTEPGNLGALPALEISAAGRRAAEDAVLRHWAETGGQEIVDAWRAAASAVR